MRVTEKQKGKTQIEKKELKINEEKIEKMRGGK